MAFSQAAAQAALSALGSMGGWCSLNTGDPGTTGASEVTGITRLATTWGSPSGRSMTGTGVLLVIPATTGFTVTHFSVWTQQVGGTFIGGDALVRSEIYSVGGGTYALVPVLAA